VPLFTFEDNLEYTNQKEPGEHVLSLVHTGKVIWITQVVKQQKNTPCCLFTLKK
jgi:hypothetical protein